MAYTQVDVDALLAKLTIAQKVKLLSGTVGVARDADLRRQTHCIL